MKRLRQGNVKIADFALPLRVKLTKTILQTEGASEVCHQPKGRGKSGRPQ